MIWKFCAGNLIVCMTCICVLSGSITTGLSFSSAFFSEWPHFKQNYILLISLLDLDSIIVSCWNIVGKCMVLNNISSFVLNYIHCIHLQPSIAVSDISICLVYSSYMWDMSMFWVMVPTPIMCVHPIWSAIHIMVLERI